MTAVASRRFALALTFLAVTVGGIKLAYLERWLLDNDNYVTLSTFFSSRSHPDYLPTARRLYDVLANACAPGDATCIANAGVIFGEQTYARPITAFFGAHIANVDALSSQRAFLDAVTAATVSHVAVATMLVVALLAAFLAAIGARTGRLVAGSLAGFGIVGYALPESVPWARFQPLLGVGAGGAAAVIAIGVAAALLARGAQRQGEASRRQPALWPYWLAAAGLLAIRIGAGRSPLGDAAVVAGSGVGVVHMLVAAAGVATFVAACRTVGRMTHRPQAAVAVALFLIFAFVSIGENFFSTAFHIAARGSIFLLAAPVMLYAALRPHGRLLWLLPLLALFHISIAELLFGCIAATELVASVRRRAASTALFLSAGLLVATGVFTGFESYNPVVPPEAGSLSGILARIEVMEFLPGLAVLTLLGAALAAAWRLPEPAGGLLVRAIVLAAILACAGQLRHVLQAAGVSILDPAAFNFILLSLYLAPMVCAAGIYLVTVALASAPEWPDGSGFPLNARAFSLLVAGVLALAAARAGTAVGRPAHLFDAIARGAEIALTRDSPLDAIDPLALEAAAPGDRYVIGPHPGHAVTMVSLLKLKARAATGLLKPSESTFVSDPMPRR